MRPIPNMVNHETNELFFDNLEIPAENLIGEEGKGFKYILDGLNAERTLIAAECIGDGHWFIDKVTRYANERVVFRPPDRPEPGRAVSDREAYIDVEAANLMRFKACALLRRATSPAAPKPTWRNIGRRCLLGSGQCLPAVSRRLWLCLRIRCRA